MKTNTVKNYCSFLSIDVGEIVMYLKTNNAQQISCKNKTVIDTCKKSLEMGSVSKIYGIFHKTFGLITDNVMKINIIVYKDNSNVR